MNSKYSLGFFSAGIVLILVFVLVGIIPMSIISESEPDDDHEEQSLTEETIPIKTELKPIENMDCVELNEFIISFEKGWGSAIPLYNEKCS